ncbi:hypothetical protein FHS28_002804 [Roseateles terrae]|uniref:Uncharacterized protein n=1 Tax=Roseateles terrae TaxID=431060 RepID=A0ABR6GTI3_9BURK|nr:hypothetical protein [Roseateles terrae]
MEPDGGLGRRRNNADEANEANEANEAVGQGGSCASGQRQALTARELAISPRVKSS